MQAWTPSVLPHSIPTPGLDAPLDPNLAPTLSARPAPRREERKLAACFGIGGMTVGLCRMLSLFLWCLVGGRISRSAASGGFTPTVPADIGREPGADDRPGCHGLPTFVTDFRAVFLRRPPPPTEKLRSGRPG